MRRLPFLIAVPFVLCLTLILRSGAPGPSAAGPVAAFLDQGQATATPAAMVRKEDAPPRYLPEPADLLAARIALGCGNCLLEKARHTEGPLAAALRELATQKFRDCLHHESAVGKSSLFEDARRNLETIASLSPRRQVLPPPAPGTSVTSVRRQPSPPKKETKREAKRAEPLMVGPDGVIYHRLDNKTP